MLVYWSMSSKSESVSACGVSNKTLDSFSMALAVCAFYTNPRHVSRSKQMQLVDAFDYRRWRLDGEIWTVLRGLLEHWSSGLGLMCKF